MSKTPDSNAPASDVLEKTLEELDRLLNRFVAPAAMVEQFDRVVASARRALAEAAPLADGICERCRINPSQVCIGCATFADDIHKNKTEGK